MFTRTTARLGRILALGVAAIVLTLGLAAAPTEAAIGVVRAKLVIKPLGPNYHVSVDGVVKMTQAEAQGFINSGHKVVVRVWGEDPISDDLLLGPYFLTPGNSVAVQTGSITAMPQGLAFRWSRRATRGQLDEDYAPETSSVFDDDDVYAGVRLVNSDGTTIRSGETNRQGSVNFELPGQVPKSSCPVNTVDC